MSESAAGTQRWGIFGGIFDPIHYAHLAMAEQAREELDLSAVLFVPAGRPVHRVAPQTSAEHRFRMIELAIAGNPHFGVSRYEIDRPEPSYMADTLTDMAAHESQPSLVLIVSAETVALMPTTWRDMERVLDLAQVAVVHRLGFEEITPDWLARNFPGRENRFDLLKTSNLGNSSTNIRARVAAGKSIRYLVPPDVEAYIREHALYAA
ncbi:MAG: nicotinate-nucleotide adenylyltransferase [Chloroflexota bacterium]